MTANAKSLFGRPQQHLALALRTELALVVQDRKRLWVGFGGGRFEHPHQPRLVYNLDPMRIGQPLGVAAVAVQGDEHTFLNLRVSECPKKLTDGLHADLPCLPLLALYGRALAILLDHEINATVWIGTAASCHPVTEFAVDQRNDLLELEPVYGPQLFN